MSNFDQFFGAGGRPIVINTLSKESIGSQLANCYPSSTGVAAAPHPSANRAIYVPFHLTESMTVYKMAIGNGATVSGNLDLGVYSEAGIKLVSSGSTPQAGTGTLQEVDITDTLLVPGRYYMAIALDNATGTYLAFTDGTLSPYKLFGMAQQATAFPLPATATFASLTSINAPIISIFGRTLAA